MDTSETYIKMRLAAIPDLGLGTPILSAMFVVTEYVFVDNKGDFYIHCDRAPYWCQLERQDQLQEMVDMSLKEKVYRFSLWALFYTTKFTLMEQLWLAFVIKEKYNKIWDGKGWK